MDRFDELTAFLDSLGERFGIPGCDCAVAIDGKPVYRHSAGFRDEENRIPVSPDDTYWIYSATKLFTCTAALRLIEQGRLELDAPVSRYLPEFAHIRVRETDGSVRPAKTTLTVRNLMSMTGGLDYEVDRPALKRAVARGETTTRKLVAALAEDPFCFDPGTHFLYSLCHDVLGAVIEQVSGLSLSACFQKIAGPLGMTDTTFHPTVRQLERMAVQYVHLDEKGAHRPMGQENYFRFSGDYESGGAGLLSTVDDYIRLAAALSRGGTSAQGVRILSEESVRLMRADQLGAVQRQDYLGRSPAAKGYSYGLGVRVLVEELGNGVPLGEFGWDGAAGAYVLIDTANRVALFYAQQVCQSYITYQYLHPALRDTLYRCLGAPYVSTDRRHLV